MTKFKAKISPRDLNIIQYTQNNFKAFLSTDSFSSALLVRLEDSDEDDEDGDGDDFFQKLRKERKN